LIRKSFSAKSIKLGVHDDSASSLRPSLLIADQASSDSWSGALATDGDRRCNTYDLVEHKATKYSVKALTSKVEVDSNSRWSKFDVSDSERQASKGVHGIAEGTTNVRKLAVFELSQNLKLTKQALYSTVGSTGFDYIKNSPADIMQHVWWNTGIDAFFINKTYKTIYEQHIPDPSLSPPPEQEVYKIVNSISVVKLPERIALEVDSINVSRSISDFAWSIGLTLLNKSSYELVKPVGSNHVEIEVSINAKVWRFFIAQGANQASGLKKSWSVSGFSKSKLLSDPFSIKKSFVESSESTASQLVTSEAVTQGFTVNWSTDLPDWVIPANTFTYQDKTPIAAISMVCEAIDAIVEPDFTSYSLNIKPKFKHSVWNWGVATPDWVINQSLIKSESDSYSPKSNYNAINVIGSVWGDCKIPGSAGDSYLPDVVNDLICTESAAQERGRAELCKAVAGEPKTIQIPLVDLIVPGELIEVVRPDNSRWRGMAEATNIQVGSGGVSVWQNLTIWQYNE